METASAPAPTASEPPPPRQPTPAGGDHGHEHGHGHDHAARLWPLMLGALGVVYGDIGTSPLYTLKESLHAFHHGSGAVVQPHEVLEVLSLIFWSLMLVVTGKYLVFVLRADNRGEGGIFALLALLPERLRAGSTSALTVPAVLDVVGAALLYGDGAITPAISVLSAVEGLRIARPELGQGSVVLIAVVILIALFRVQKSGTKLLGLLFGPVMAVWFSTLALLGVVWIAKTPVVLQALSPHHAFNYFAHHGVAGMSILGSVVLAVTGGEALYADMGHFGRAPIRRAWLGLVMPALVLSYFGQGALVIANPAAAANPFFAQVPLGGATIALVVLSSVATVIASQALISGAYSLTRQAMQLGFFPRVTVRHTTSEHEGQIYIPELNELLAVACIGLVLAFRESSALAAAYGIAVTGTMAITSVLFALVTHLCFGWSRRRALLIGAVFLCIDLPFLGANLAKVADGGWVPLLAGAIIVVIMLVWHEGRRFLAALNVGRHRPFEEVWPEVERHVACRTPGVGVFMASSDDGVPPVLLHHVKRSRALHRTIVLLTVKTADRPRVELRERLVVEKLHHGFARVIVSYGYMEEPDVPRALKLAAVRRDLDVDLDAVTWYLAREHVVGGPGGQMGELTERLFAFLQNGRR